MTNNNATVAAKVRTKSQVRTEAKVDASRTTLLATGVAASVVGLWAAACFVSALVTSGPVELVSGFASALLGV